MSDAFSRHAPAARDGVAGRHWMQNACPASFAGQALGAAARPVLALVTGAPMQGVLLGSFHSAVIIEVPAASGSRVLSILSRKAAGVPNGIRIADRPSMPTVRPGDPVEIGAGSVHIGNLRVQVVRSWRTRVDRIRPTATSLGSLAVAAANAERGVPPDAVSALERALLDDRHRLTDAVPALVGLGRGLTPAGDDVLAGLLTGLHACGQTTLVRRVAELAQPTLPDRTTLLSADLLRLAAQGHACLEVLALLHALNDRRNDLQARTASSIQRLLTLGHTSGADLATGLSIGLRYGALADALPNRREA